MCNNDATPLISICIATIDSPKSVKELIDSLYMQCLDDVEVIICDESSDDITENIVKECNIPIRYYRRKKSGLDSAIIFLTEKSLGDFIWWFGDDIFLDGAVSEVVSVVKNNKGLNFIWVNSRDKTQIDQTAFPNISNFLYRDKDDILDFDIGMLGFISATIIRRSVALKGVESAKKHIGSAFVCLSIVLFVITQPGKAFFIGRPCFESSPKPSGEVRWYDQFQVFGINLFIISKEFEYAFSKKKFKRAISKNLTKVLKSIIAERGMGLTTGFASTTISIKPLIKLFWRYSKLWLYLPLIILPRKIIIFLYKFVK